MRGSLKFVHISFSKISSHAIMHICNFANLSLRNFCPLLINIHISFLWKILQTNLWCGHGLPLRTLANAFLMYHEKNWWKSYSLEYRSFYYWKHVNKVLVLFNLPKRLEHFQIYLKSNHVTKFFTIKNEKGKVMSPFLM